MHKNEILYSIVDSSVGPLTLVESPLGLMMLSFGRHAPTRWLAEVRGVYGEVHVRCVDRVLACGELDEYFAGTRTRFEAPLDLALATEFQRGILRELMRVPYGSVVSYGELARRAGKPGAARAVGGAMRQNPVAIIVPCHRVTAADGSIGGFSGGLNVKQSLHRLEGICVPDVARRATSEQAKPVQANAKRRRSAHPLSSMRT